MSELLKIVVTDSGGNEHIFNEEKGVIENWLNLKDEDGYVTILTRTFDHSGKLENESNAIFILPRRVDVLYGKN